MPIYEYECTGCQARFERWQKIHEEPVKTCPECGGATRKVVHPVGIIFKGSGFYVTDNRKPSAPATSPAKGEGESATGKSEAGEKSASSESSAGKSGAGEKAEAKVGSK